MQEHVWIQHHAHEKPLYAVPERRVPSFVLGALWEAARSIRSTHQYRHGYEPQQPRLQAATIKCS
jgi:hypothetical protein